MKTTNLAMAVATTFLASGSAFAAQVYSGDGSSLAIGGYVDVGVGKYGSDKVEVHDVSPRLNIEGKREIGNGVTVDAKGEWALNYLDGGDNSFTTRLGYIGASHDQLGRVVVGTQWAPYYDVAGVADMPIAFANDFLYGNNFNQLGSARAEKMVSYRNSIRVSDDVAFDIGLGWQGDQGNGFDSRGQIAVSTEFAGFGLGYTFSGGDALVNGKKEDATSHVFSAKYGTYGKGMYVALVYGDNQNFYSRTYTRNNGLDVTETFGDTQQYEAIAAYALDNGLNMIVNYEMVDAKKHDTIYQQTALQVEYTVVSGLVTFAGYQFDLSNDVDAKKEDQYTVGVRYIF